VKVDDRDKEALANLIKSYGRDVIEAELGKSSGEITYDLTIVSNGGLHTIPSDFIFGELYVASEGNLDFSSLESVSSELDNILSRLREKLRSRRWKNVYLIPFGHSVISMNIKMAVYRTLRIETSDVFYFGSGQYGVLKRDTRKILLS
jgi:hypothetical protein